MAQLIGRHLRRPSGTRYSEPEPETPSGIPVTENDAVRATFHEGVMPQRGSTIYTANPQTVAIAHKTRDWEQGAALHAAPRPDPGAGAPYHGAPWDWTINGSYVDTYKYVNLWHEAIPYGATTGFPLGCRIQWRNLGLWTIEAASLSESWDKRLGPGAIPGSQMSSGAPGGGYFRTTPDYFKTMDIGTNRRTESLANGGGWSISHDPMFTAGGSLLDDKGVLHGPFLNTDSPDRIEIPVGGYVCYYGEARLIMDDYSAVPSSMRMMARLGSDNFTAKTKEGDPPSARSTSMCNPAMKVLPTGARPDPAESGWVTLYFASGSPAMIRDSFPPLPFVNA